MNSELYKPNADKVAAEIIDDEAIIINVATGNYYNTEGIGGWVWQQCSAGKSLNEIATHAVGRFAVDAEKVMADLNSFFASLQEEELVSQSNDARSSGGSSPEELEPRLAYQAPKLVAYRDLRDLLALDPPMPRLGADTGASLTPSR